VALAFRAIRNKIQTNGGEIFQEESGRGAILRTGNGISQAFGKLNAFDGDQESSYNVAMTEGRESASLGLQLLTVLKSQKAL
jgi:hypothetical protein